MGIIYLGDQERISQELREAKEALDDQYRKVLGDENVRRLDETSSRILNASSFYSDRTAFSRICGEEVGGPNKFAIASDKTFELDKSGRLKERKIRTAPLFYLSEEGFTTSGSAKYTDRRLVSYVHEFDHYVWYVLQKVPSYIASLGIASNIGANPDLKNLEPFLVKEAQKDLPREESVRRMGLASFNAILYDIYEKANLILDNAILEPIGIQRPMPWRGERRKYAMAAVHGKAGIVLPIGGDPFYSLDSGEVIKRFLNWEEFGEALVNDQHVKSLVQSVKELKVSRVSFTDLQKIASRKH